MNALVKMTAIALIFVGEAFSISAQLMASKKAELSFTTQGGFLIWMLIAGAVGGVLLVAGYIVGYSRFQNIWIVTAISIGSIVIFEPILAAILFRQLPTLGSGVGLILGICAIIAAVFF
ncbi:hypothetical protein K8R03_04840 [Candidatus Kaiserbacteria bacterium]|nr:hypothetical protein [Candidatus Kaiserbacteria bacterium]